MCRRLAAAIFCLASAACGLTLEGSLTGLPDADAGPDSDSVSDADAGPDSVSDSAFDAASDSASVPDSGSDGSRAADSARDADAAPPDAGIVHAVGALLFNGTSQYVDVGALAIPTDFTVEAWAHPSAFPVEQLLVGKDRSGQGGSQFRFGVLMNGHVFFIMSDTGGNTHGLYTSSYQLTSPQPLVVGQWTHVAVTKSGAAFAIVVAGAQVATLTADASFTHGGTQATRIAARTASDGTSATSFFSGTIDEVRVWSIARTAAQIAADMATTIPANHPQRASLVGYWRFDDGAGATAADDIGAHNGSLVLGPLWVASTAF
jgi:Concanavalin A-like lectin/glucanases superfamily